MGQKFATIPLLLAIVACLFGATCTEDDSDTVEDAGDTEETGDTADSDGDVPTDTGGKTLLDSSHPGWENPGCWSSNCHPKDSTHNSTSKPHQCVECHGNNGSTQRSHSRECVGCHEPLTNHTPQSDFNNSVNCKVCHK